MLTALGFRLRKTLLITTCLVVLLTISIPQNANGVSTKIERSNISFRTGTVDIAAEQDFLARTNALRASLGLGALKTNSELLTKARSWSQTQANSGTIFHSTLTNGVTQNWYRLGENVGMGPTSPAIHDALVRSPRHYENLVDPGFTDVGIGVIRQGEIIYVTQVFMQLMPESANNQSQTPTSQAQNPKQQSKASAAAAPAQQAPIAEAVPLKTASAELSAVIKKLSALEA